jgi:hypothetical protein
MSAIVANDGQRATPEEEKDLLLRIITELVQKQLERGPSVGFAATLGSKRDAKVVMPTDWEPVSSRSELAEYWDYELGQVVGSETRAACYCASIRLPGADAIGVLIHIEHAEGSSEDGCRRDGISKKLLLQEPVSAVVPRHIFAPSQNVP